MGNRCFRKTHKVKSNDEELSPPLRFPIVKKQSIIRTTDDMPNKPSIPLTLNLNPLSIEKNSSESSNNVPFLPPQTPRTIVHTSSLQKRRNSEVNSKI